MPTAHDLEQRARLLCQSDLWKKRLDPGIGHQGSRVIVGPIAAGEKVVSSKRAATAKFIREHYGDALAVEMEGHGFLEGVHINHSVQGCVVRGISDLLSRKANADRDGSQRRAADAASAVAFEILSEPCKILPVEELHGQFLEVRSEQNHPAPTFSEALASRPPPDHGQPFPDLTVQQLFFYIDPDCLGDQGKESQRIGADILDQLSIGRLTAWGREADRRSGSPLSEIAKTYWRDAHLTYWYFSDGFREEVHVEPIRHAIGPSYRDLQFNRAQAEAIWTPDSRPNRSERIGAIEAFLRILESSKWAADLTAQPDRFTFDAPYPNSVTPAERTRVRLIRELDRDMHDRLRSGTLSAWGRPHHSAPLRPISQSEWDDIALLTDKTAFEHPTNACAMTRKRRNVCYTMIELSRRDVAQVYQLTV